MKKQQGRTQDLIVLEQGSLQSLRLTKQRMSKLLEISWAHYSELARQRNAIQDELKAALLQTCISNYKFQKFQRCVKFKYSFHPFSTVGSLQFIGRRFNTGIEVNSQVPSFPGLYLAINKDTAMQEHLAQQPSSSQLTPREIALTAPDSVSTISISGQLELVFDLRNADGLKPIVELMKKFTISKDLMQLARTANTQLPRIIKTPQLLLDTLLVPNWSFCPANLDIPANSQIFGHLVYSAGISGILYPSKFTKDLCLAVFPHNFVNTDSHLMLDDDTPHPNVPKKIEQDNWRICDLDQKEILNEK